MNPQPKPVRVKVKRKSMARRLPRRLFTAQNDEARKAWVRTQLCCVREGWMWKDGCAGRTEAAHEGRKPGLAMKCPDSQTIPMCREHHRQWTEHTGVFTGWTKDERRVWADARIEETTARYERPGRWT